MTSALLSLSLSLDVFGSLNIIPSVARRDEVHDDNEDGDGENDHHSVPPPSPIIPFCF